MTEQPTVFFDLDGTLTNPRQGIVSCIQYALGRMDVASPPQDVLTQCIGPPLKESFTQLVGPSRAPQAITYYRERFSDRGWRENQRYPGIVQGLASLKSLGYKLFVATSKPAVFAHRIVDYFELEPYFERVFGSELDGTRSHKADLLKYALTNSTPSQNVIMVGDRRHDVLGAKANGLKSIGVTYGFGSRAELESSGADQIVASVSELFSLLSGSAGQPSMAGNPSQHS